MTLDEFLCLGETVDLGSHRFEAEAIKEFARKFDPQPFHVDEEAARRSVFGALCASGWHTASIWMKKNLEKRLGSDPADWTGPGPVPTFGPSPGFRNLRWLKPVYAGETISFDRTVTAHRPLASRPGWKLLSLTAGASDSKGDKVIEFESSVMLQAD